jgi:hypothetical protein
MLFKPEWSALSAVALLLWIPFGLWLFARQRPTRAATHVLVWGMMWLPEAAAFDLPVLPPLDKYMICALIALTGLRWKAPKRLRAARVWRGWDWFVIALFAGLIPTVANNGEVLRYGEIDVTELPALTAYDWLYTALSLALTILVPCVLGRSLIRNRKDLIEVLTILVKAGLVYSIPIIWELRMSPMLHMNFYGFMPRSDWLQNMRQGGWRPTVFMGHGLVVGFFMFLSTTAAIALKRAGKSRFRWAPMWAVILYLFVMLVLCKAMGALIYGVVAYALQSWLGVKNRMRVLALLVLIVAAYPLSRMLDLFPVEQVVSSASEMMGPDRAQSLQFRFDNEDMVLTKGAEKLWFGWGGFARDHVYDDYLGKDLVIQDGYWIVVFGQTGLFGFLCTFSLILLPILRARKAVRKLRGRVDLALLSGLAVMVTICAVNLLPNMSLPNLQLFFAAGLAVLAREMPRQARQEAAIQVTRPSVRPGSFPPDPGYRRTRKHAGFFDVVQPPKD